MSIATDKTVHKFNAHDLEIISVTVYTDRAEVKRNIKLKLESGINEVLIEKLALSANNDSIGVNGHGDATIHEVQVNDVPVLPDESSQPRTQKLKEELQKLEREKREFMDRKKLAEKRYELLNTIVEKAGETVMHLKGEVPEQLVSVFNVYDNIKKLINCHEEEQTEALGKIRFVEEELRKIDEKIHKLNQEIRDERNGSAHIKNISVILESEKGGNIELDVSYQVFNASWHPTYEIRVQSTTRKLQLKYIGNICQSTKEDWLDAPLILSTAQPSLKGAAPQLGTLNAEFYKAPTFRTPKPMFGVGRAFYQSLELSAQNEIGEQANGNAEPPELSYGGVAVETSVVSAMFTVARRASIPSDSGYHKVIIAVIDLNPILFYETVPSKCPSVYLTASVVNESVLPLLDGQASVYVDKNFIAKNHIKAASPGERFLCSLGADPAIKVQYKPVHKYSEQGGLINRSLSTINEQKIIIKNTKSTSVLITVREHVPLSTDERIKVRMILPELDNKSSSARNFEMEPTVGARLDVNHNLEWTVDIEANSEKELTVKWSVERPNGQMLTFREVFPKGNII